MVAWFVSERRLPFVASRIGMRVAASLQVQDSINDHHSYCVHKIDFAQSPLQSVLDHFLEECESFIILNCPVFFNLQVFFQGDIQI